MIQALDQTYDLKRYFFCAGAELRRLSRVEPNECIALPASLPERVKPGSRDLCRVSLPRRFHTEAAGVFYDPFPMGHASHASSVSWACPTPVPFSAENNGAVARPDSVAAAARSTAAASP